LPADVPVPPTAVETIPAHVIARCRGQGVEPLRELVAELRPAPGDTDRSVASPELRARARGISTDLSLCAQALEPEDAQRVSDPRQLFADAVRSASDAAALTAQLGAPDYQVDEHLFLRASHLSNRLDLALRLIETEARAPRGGGE
jgi:hypothetical protein